MSNKWASAPSVYLAGRPEQGFAQFRQRRGVWHVPELQTFWYILIRRSTNVAKTFFDVSGG